MMQERGVDLPAGYPFLSGDSIRSLDQLRRFMASHVFWVWGRMILLKRIQSDLAPSRFPWKPNRTIPPGAQRMINEIVVTEESDFVPEAGGEGYCSHFDLFLGAMEEVGAYTRPARELVAATERLAPLPRVEGVPEEAYDFLEDTLCLAEWGRPHQVVAGFALGRKTGVPAMLREVGDRLGLGRTEAPLLQAYLDRHPPGGDMREPILRELLSTLIAGDPGAWRETVQAARAAVGARSRLWAGIAGGLRALDPASRPDPVA